MQQIEVSTVGTLGFRDGHWNCRRGHLALSSQATATFETAVLDKQLAHWSNGCLWLQTKAGIFVEVFFWQSNCAAEMTECAPTRWG